MSNRSKIVFAVALTFCLTCLMFTALPRAFGLPAGRGRFSRLETVASLVDSRYIGEFDREAAEDAAIDAYLAETGDPYAAYYNGDEASSFKNTMSGSYVGIGIEVLADTENDEIVVISAFNGSPAMRAGVKSGDVIEAIDGVGYGAADMSKAVEYMKGVDIEKPEGTEVTLSLRRSGENVELRVAREEIDMYRIETSVVGNSLLYVRYSGFSRESAQKLAELLDGAEGGYNGVILDLRENPGGDLDAAVEVCDIFLDDGLIMYTEDKAGKRAERRASEGSCSLPLAVLVDEGSASASEVVAGCIQARGRGVVIGEKTFGKGVSQMIFFLDDDNGGEIVKITGYKNYRPDGIWLDEAVTPDIEVDSEVEMDEFGNAGFGDEDPVLKRAEEELGN